MVETHGYINMVGCKEMATTVTAAHHSIWMHMYDSMHAAQNPKSNLKFVTLDKESLWRQEKFLRFLPGGETWTQKTEILFYYLLLLLETVVSNPCLRVYQLNDNTSQKKSGQSVQPRYLDHRPVSFFMNRL